MKQTYFVKVPVDSSPLELVGLSVDKQLGPMYAVIGNGCSIVERFKSCGSVKIPGNPYVWVDEEGHLTSRPLNARASHQLYPNYIAGVALIEVGKYDLDKPEDFRALVKKLSDWPKQFQPKMEVSA